MHCHPEARRTGLTHVLSDTSKQKNNNNQLYRFYLTLNSTSKKFIRLQIYEIRVPMN